MISETYQNQNRCSLSLGTLSMRFKSPLKRSMPCAVLP